jgi:hypothetical protein
VEGIQSVLGPGNPVEGDLNRLRDQLRGLIRGGMDGRVEDLSEIESLMGEIGQVIDRLNSIELELSQQYQLLLGRENVRIARDEEIPQGYRPVVEEYTRQLSNEDND